MKVAGQDDTWPNIESDGESVSSYIAFCKSVYANNGGRRREEEDSYLLEDERHNRKLKLEAEKRKRKQELEAEKQKKQHYIEVVADLRDQGYRVHEFVETAEDIMNAINFKKPVGDFDLLTNIQDPNFRFVCYDNVDLSLTLSTSYSVLAEYSKHNSLKKASKSSIEKRQDNADEFAKKMYPFIVNFQTKHNVTSLRKTIDLLNKEGAETYNGGKWHVKTLQDLNRRWKELGIISEPH